MKTKIIIHNSISLDGSLTGFMPEMELHYKIAGEYKPDAHLIGSETIIKGIDMFGESVPDEEPTDFEPPQRESTLPWWIIVDSEGKLEGKLHTCRRFEYCRDVIILISENTGKDYISHLDERKYNYIISGRNKVDLKKAINQLNKKFNIKKILTDTGRILGNILVNSGLVAEISLLIHPVLIGENCYPMFSDVNKNLKLKLKKSEIMAKGCVWLVYCLDGPTA